uniref:START domain-containing protein n=1 Tax=Compsopogon caeruleus TaxID=31354 RepID=A0A7S1XEW2_9RHOD|mmetsp:Transcript_18332/g.38308  ORF Transcript_18332/g.38308 Transcript_18332/m.38308 type:complete len:350 (+) Transcript_18332:92-1141(+)
MENVCEAVERVLSLYSEDKLFQASRELAKIENDLGHLSEDSEERLFLKNHVGLRPVRDEANKVTLMMNTMRSDEGWSPCYQGPSTKVSFRKEPNSAILTFKIEGLVVAKVGHVACIINEIDLFPDIFWFIREGKTLKKIGRMKRVLHVRSKILWPILDRDFLSHAAAIDGLDQDDCIAILTIEDLADQPASALARYGITEEDLMNCSNSVRAEMEVNFVFTPVEPTITKVICVARADPKLPFVPVQLINWIGRAFGRLMLKAIEAKANNLSVTHRKRYEGDPLYRWIEERIGQYWAARGRKEEFDQGVVDLNRRESIENNVDTAPKGPGRAIMMSLAGRKVPWGSKAEL